MQSLHSGQLDRENTNQFMLQYFAGYGLGGWWGIATQPLMTANWKADSKRWLVPIGGGINKMFTGKIPVQLKVHAYWHAARPELAADDYGPAGYSITVGQ